MPALRQSIVVVVVVLSSACETGTSAPPTITDSATITDSSSDSISTAPDSGSFADAADAPDSTMPDSAYVDADAADAADTGPSVVCGDAGPEVATLLGGTPCDQYGAFPKYDSCAPGAYCVPFYEMGKFGCQSAGCGVPCGPIFCAATCIISDGGASCSYSAP